MKPLKRSMGPISLLLITINGTIGSAWLFSPYYAAQSAGPAALVAWLLGAAIIIVIAFCFAELSTLFPVAGGVSKIPYLTHGALTSFMISWIAWLSCVAMPPIEVLATLQYASIYFPSLVHVVNHQHVLTALGYVWATLLMLLLCGLNIIRIKKLIHSNTIMTLFKVGIIVIISVSLLLASHYHLYNHHYLQHFSPHGWHGIMSAVAVGGIAFAFTGFRHGVELAAEAKKPTVTIPIAIIGSILCCLLLYVLLQFAFFAGLDPKTIAHGWSQLQFHNDAGPFAGIALLLGLGWLAGLIYLNAIVSPLGAGLVYVASTSRIVYAMSRNHYFPKCFSHLNHNHIPALAIGLNFIIGMSLFLPFPGWQSMISFLVSSVAISYGMGPVSLIALRYQLPDTKRPFHLPAGIVLSAIAFYCCNLLAFWSGWHIIEKIAIVSVIGLIFFFVYQRYVNSKQAIDLKSGLWLLPYLLGLTLISSLGTFGGGHQLIPFGWDFLVIGIFSLMILCLAVKCRIKDKTKLIALQATQNTPLR